MRGYELEELTAYFGSEKSSAWKYYAPAFEHLSDEKGNPRIAFAWTWPGFFLGPFYLFARKNYIASLLLIAIAVALSYVHTGAFFATWCTGALIAPHCVFRRFLRVVQAARLERTEKKARLEHIAKEGGLSAWIGVLELFS